MTRCIIKSGIWTLYNNVSFVEVDNDNNVKFGYLMYDNDISYASKEYICDYFHCITRRDALNFALVFNNKCDSLKDNFFKLEDYMYQTRDFMRKVAHSMTA